MDRIPSEVLLVQSFNHFVDKIVSKYGAPVEKVIDHGSFSKSYIFKVLGTKLVIDPVITTHYLHNRK